MRWEGFVGWDQRYRDTGVDGGRGKWTRRRRRYRGALSVDCLGLYSPLVCEPGPGRPFTSKSK